MKTNTELEKTKADIDFTTLSDRKLQLLRNCYWAIYHAEDDKIEEIFTEHYRTDDWLEEEITPRHPVIEVVPTGIMSFLNINGVSCNDYDKI